ncbi:MAG: 30S ribosomal protein S14 [Ostreibacterium sp.]
MAKQCMINREAKRIKTVNKFAVKRETLKKIILSPNYTDDEKAEARAKLQKLPRNASPVRVQRRCRVTGRPHAVYRKFGLCRNKLREQAMEGNVPGLRKASW